MSISKFIFVLTIPLIFIGCGSSTDSSTNIQGGDITEEQKEVIEPSWTKSVIIDEFGDEIDGKSALGAIFSGTMSNTATQNSKLMVKMNIQDSILYTQIYEYERNLAQLPEYKYVWLKVKSNKGDITKVKQLMYSNMMVDMDHELLSLLTESKGELKVICDLSTVSEYESSVYKYSIDNDGLSELE